MSRILLTTIGSFGDLHPKIALGLGLRERGHDIVFATHKEYGPKIESLGFEFHPIRPDNTALNDPQEMARMMDVKTGTEYILRNWVFANLRETYNDLIGVAKDADLIITGEGVVAARLVAETLDIPWVLNVLSPISFMSAYDLPLFPFMSWLTRLGSFSPVVGRLVLKFAKFVTSKWCKPVHQLRSELGLPAIKNPLYEDKFSPHLNLAMFSSVLGVPQLDWPANTVITGFTFYDGSQEQTKLAPELKRFLDAGEPPIVFTLGSAAVLDPGNFYQESIKAAQQLNRRAVLLIGKNSPPENLSKDAIAIDYVPYSQIFPHACIIVHQGGIGTTAQALRSGKPTLVMPYSHDQPDNAARLERLGTSRTIPRKQYTARQVIKVLGELLDDPNYTEKAAAIGHIVQAEDGVGLASDRIEKLLNQSN